MGRVILVISLLFNLLFIGTGSYVATQVDGFDFVKTRMQSAPPSTKRDTAYYMTKKSIFEHSEVSDVDKVFIGDSMTDYGEFQEYFPDEVVLNRGIRSDVSKGVLNRIDEVVNRNAKEAYLMIGVNDIRYRTEARDFEENVSAIVESFAGKDTKLFIQSILPVNNRLYGNKISNQNVLEFNEVLIKVAEAYGIDYIDLYPSFVDQDGQLNEAYTVDGLHLNGRGYEVWVERLRSR